MMGIQALGKAAAITIRQLYCGASRPIVITD
jgi:hypothetical protein